MIVNAESWNTKNPVKYRMRKEKVAGATDEGGVEFSYIFDKKAPF